MYTYSPSDSIADFAQAANTIRAMPGVSIPVPSVPSQTSVFPQQMAAPVDPIQRGISALYMKGAELTSGGQQPMTFADGGSADKYYSAVLGLTGTPFYRRVLGETVEPSMTPMPQTSAIPAYTPIPTAAPASQSMTIAEQVPSFIEETISDGDGFTTTPGEISGISPTTVASDPAVFEALVDTPAISSLTGIPAETISNISTGLSVGKIGAGLAGLPGVAGLMGLANIGFQSPIGILGSVVGAFNPPLGLAINAFGGLASLIADNPDIFGVETNALGQTQQFGFGNENIDAFGNVIGGFSIGLDTAPGGLDAPTAGMGFGPAVDTAVAEAVAAQRGEEAFGSGMTGTDGGSGDAAATDGGIGIGDDSPGDPGFNRGGLIDLYAVGGGISALAYGGEAAPAGYANKAFEGMVSGQGSGMSDSVPFSIEGQQPALLSRDEYVLPADVVSQLGDGSSGAGADMLDSFVSQVRQQKYGHTNQPPANGGGLMGVLSAAAGGSLMPMMGRI